MMKTALILLFFVSCSHINTINLHHHSFGNKPAKIIWLQIAGFSEEHLAMLRFGMSEANKKTSFENMTCLGKIWNYNLFKLRPSLSAGFRSQMLGSPNIQNNCSDLEKKPIWSSLYKMGYRTGILEGNVAQNESISNMVECQKNNEKIVLWKMNQSKEGPFFHYQEQEKYGFGTTYFDKSCQKGSCYSSLYDNVKSLERIFQKSVERSIFIVREFGYAHALNQGEILRANEILLELEKILAYFLKKYKDHPETLVLVTSSAVRNIEFPNQGEPWADFIKKGKGIVFKNQSLISTSFASGASAENFCGVYDEYEILHRLFWMTNTSKVEQRFMDFF